MHKLLMFITVLGLAVGAQAATVQIDFGVPDPNIYTYLQYPPMPADWNPSPAPWNNAWYVNDAWEPNTEQLFPNLTTTTGANSGLTLSVSENFTTDGGTAAEPNNLLGYPETTRSVIGTQHRPADPNAVPPRVYPDWSSSMTISGCTEAEYTLVVWASQKTGSWGGSNYRRGYYSVDGGASMQFMAYYANDDTVLTFPNVAPDGNGEITLSLMGQLNLEPLFRGNANIAVLEIIIPEPATMSLLALGGLVAFRRRRR